MVSRWLARVACLLCLFCVLSARATAGETDTRALELPPQPLSESLLALSAEFGRPTDRKSVV